VKKLKFGIYYLVFAAVATYFQDSASGFALFLSGVCLSSIWRSAMYFYCLLSIHFS